MLITVTPATVEPVTLEEVKEHLRLDHDEDDGLIGTLITGARQYVELYTGRALAAATYRWAAESGSPYTIPLWPAEVTAVTYMQNGARVEADVLDFDADRSLLCGHFGEAVRVEFSTDPDDVPDIARAAILLRVEAMYDASPDDKQKLNAAADELANILRMNMGV